MSKHKIHKRESISKAEDDDTQVKEVVTVEEEETAGDDDDDNDVGIPILLSDNKEKPGVVFVLEKASLEIAKVGKTYQLLNSDDHANFLRKNNRNPADYRPDITHQALMMILDSPVNKAGRLRAIFIRTELGVLFEVAPNLRIPRTFKRFASVMVQLLQKLSIRAVGSRTKLIKAIKNPIIRHLPVNPRIIGFSRSSEKMINIQKQLANLCNDGDTIFVLGAMAHGKIECDYINEFVSGICEALSTNWNIL